MDPVIFLLLVTAIVLVFTFTNGFHDAANAIATVVGTRVLAPRAAVTLGAVTNLLGALSGIAVATTIGAGLVDSHFITTATIFCAMLGGIVWNILTWYFGLPSSSSHALIGGLIGAAFASARNNWNVLVWSGLYPKVILPMVTSPIIGFIGGMIAMAALFAAIRPMRPATVDKLFGRLQLLSASYMGWAHGYADGQKTMGVLALACFVATKSGSLKKIPAWLGFLVAPEFEVKSWMIWSCGITMALGTYIGGWRIIQTLGHKLVRLRPDHGFAAETTAASVLLVTGSLGMTVSTTHVITTAIMGVGCARRFSALNWTLVERIVWAWLLTIPATALLGYVLVSVGRAFGWMN